jgi:D-alanine-D-alanine ligase
MARILVLYNHPTLAADHPESLSEHSVVEHAEHVEKVLRLAGFRTILVGLKEDPRHLVKTIDRYRPDAVFNLYEGSYSNGETEAFVAGIMEWLEIPFTGSPFRALSVALAKHVTKQLLRGAGLPTPDFFVVEKMPVPRSPIAWPVIVKPACHDASAGLDQESVVTSQARLVNRVEFILTQYGPPVLVEEFIPGRELNVALLETSELRVLPPAEIAFQKKSRSWPILTYAGKWNTTSQDFLETPARCPAEIPWRLRQRVEELARRAFLQVGCRDYARVDFRVRHNGKPYILEVNPNPDISACAGFARCLNADGIALEDFFIHVAQSALLRQANGKSGATSPLYGTRTRAGETVSRHSSTGGRFINNVYTRLRNC